MTAVPLATYRLQLTKEFDFDAAAALATHLKDLGITHVYASPLLKARPGSTHCYDVVDHDKLNPELGGEQGFARFSAALERNGLKLILDFVPNHMGVGHADNAWWLDVLEWGRNSPYAMTFDIDWDVLPHRRHPGVLIPILGRPYGDVLQSGEIAMRYDAETGSFAVWYFDHKLPINPQRYGELIRTIVAAAGANEEIAGRALIAVAGDYRDPNAPSYHEAPELKRRLSQIEGAAEVIGRGLAAYDSGSEAGATALHRLLERQHYRLAYWRVAFSAVNYRRFFDINDLAGLRIEHLPTFRAVHALVARLIEADQLHGLRLDHIDGLRDPMQYARRLQHLIRKMLRKGNRDGSFYIVVEKILADREPMPQFPGVSGSTGYESLNVISRILVDGDGLEPLEQTWRDFTGERNDFASILETAKMRVIDTMLASEFTVLCDALSRIAAGHFSTRDFTLDRLHAALQRYVIEFPIYRTYVRAAGVSAADRKIIEDAISRARAGWRGPDPEIFDFLRDVITLDLATNHGYSAPRVRNFALKLQQFTGPLMAKSMEDTVFYRFNRLIALNEVGGEPAASALSLAEFHARQQQRATNLPGGLTATATHDTKRGEDARARILALSELAYEWNAAVHRWRELNAGLVKFHHRERQPSLSHEYMIYQSLIGAWPETIDKTFVKRMRAYALKAARESKQETSWSNPNAVYEENLEIFIEHLLDEATSLEFLSSFMGFAQRAALLGALNGLSQLALKTLMPGVPDFYQGTELWDLSLVDPDNRRPVDFAARQCDRISDSANWDVLVRDWRDGRIKLALMRHLLRLRHRFADVLSVGSYEPIHVKGQHANNVIAFKRALGRQKLIIAVGRHFAPLTNRGQIWPAEWEAVVEYPGKAAFEDLIDTNPIPGASKISLAALFRILPVSVVQVH